VSAAPWDQPGYEPLTLSELLKGRREDREREARKKAASEPKTFKKSRSIPAASLRKHAAARLTPSRRPGRAATASPEVVVRVRQEEPAVIEALGNLTKAVAELATRKQPAPIVNVEVPARKMKTTTHRDAEGFITHTETEPVED
jgi:hypothetical protein